MKNVMSGLDWVAKLAYLNILWLLFTLVGAIVFGFYPATVAMYTVIRRWQMDGDHDVNFRQFFNLFKQEFWKSNLLGLCLTGIGFLMYVNVQYMYAYDSGIHQFIKFPLTIVMFIVALMLLYVIPVYVHYQVKMKEVFKYALLLMMIHPFYNIAMLISLAFVYLAMLFLPNTIFFFLGSVSAFIIMRVCMFIFTRVAYKQEKLGLGKIN